MPSVKVETDRQRVDEGQQTPLVTHRQRSLPGRAFLGLSTEVSSCVRTELAGNGAALSEVGSAWIISLSRQAGQQTAPGKARRSEVVLHDLKSCRHDLSVATNWMTQTAVQG